MKVVSGVFEPRVCEYLPNYIFFYKLVPSFYLYAVNIHAQRHSKSSRFVWIKPFLAFFKLLSSIRNSFSNRCLGFR